MLFRSEVRCPVNNLLDPKVHNENNQVLLTISSVSRNSSKSAVSATTLIVVTNPALVPVVARPVAGKI
ncbi:hypothetical protein TNIN_350931 [Trichonephila inaurata madagascariensis]|uniref:Uncharacterized protein n=1 Tax=Trichonephila inaurata madagascariensis TaxID=2747483 RepID=A0A8X6IR98_9ARAC|nr:hypothetical protein TNIN_350931 [Trichonephila inaurata madagascariensis]